jgi:hypothetical protein
VEQGLKYGRTGKRTRTRRMKGPMFALLSSRLGIYGIIALVLTLAFGSLYAAWKIQTYRLDKAKSELATAETTIAIQNTAIAVKEQNTKAQKKVTTSAKKDQDQVFIVEEEIKDLPERYLNEAESRTARNLIHHFMCGGELPSGGADCLNYPSVLPPTSKTPLVSIREFIGACEQISEYCHAWERYGTCIEESMTIKK